MPGRCGAMPVRASTGTSASASETRRTIPLGTCACRSRSSQRIAFPPSNVAPHGSHQLPPMPNPSRVLPVAAMGRQVAAIEGPAAGKPLGIGADCHHDGPVRRLEQLVGHQVRVRSFPSGGLGAGHPAQFWATLTSAAVALQASDTVKQAMGRRPTPCLDGR